MANAEEIYPDRICWICNAIEPADKLVTCCYCRRSTEHTCCMRNKHFGTRVFWYCGECRSTRYTTNRSPEKARPRQELADGKFKKIKRSAKRSDPLTPSERKLIKRSISYISSDTCKARQTSKRIKRPTVRPGSSLKCLTTGNDSDGVHKMKDSGTVGCSGFKIRDANFQEKDLPVALVINGYGEHAQRAFWKSPELVEFSPSSRADAVTEGNNCARSDTSLEGKHKTVDMEGIRETQNSDISVPGVADLPCLPSPVSKDPNYVNPSSVKIPSANVSNPIDLDGPPGFSSLITPRVSRCSSSQHPSSSHKTTCEGSMPSRMESGGHIVETTSEPHQVQPKLNLQKADASLDTSSGFLEPNSGASNNVKSSVVNVPLKKVTDLIDPDTPPGFSSLRIHVPDRLLSSQHSSRSHKINPRDPRLSRMNSSSQIAATTVGGYKPASTPNQVQPKCDLQKADASLDTSSGFLEPNSGASTNVKSYVVNVPLKKVTNLIDPDTPPGFSSPRIHVPDILLSSQHSSRSHKINPRDPRLSRMNSSSQIAATTVGGYKPASTPNQVQPKCDLQKADVILHTSDFSKFGPHGFPELASNQNPNSSSPVIHMEPMSPIKKCSGYEHSTILGGNPHENEVQPRFHQVGGPVYQDIRPGFSHFGPPPFPPLPNYSTRPSSLPEFPSEAVWSSRLDRRGHLTSTIAGGYTAPASQMHEMQPNYPQMPAVPHHHVFRPEFPYFPSYPARPSSSAEIPFNATWSSRAAGRGHVPSNIVGGYATAASQQNKMQPNYPQGPPTA